MRGSVVGDEREGADSVSMASERVEFDLPRPVVSEDAESRETMLAEEEATGASFGLVLAEPLRLSDRFDLTPNQVFFGRDEEVEADDEWSRSGGAVSTLETPCPGGWASLSEVSIDEVVLCRLRRLPVNSDGMGELMTVSGGSGICSSVVSGVGSVVAGATTVRAASWKIPPRVRPSELNLQNSIHQYRPPVLRTEWKLTKECRPCWAKRPTRGTAELHGSARWSWNDNYGSK